MFGEWWGVWHKPHLQVTPHNTPMTFPTLIGHLIGARKEHPFFLKWGYFLNFKRYLVWGVGWDNCL